MIRIVLFAVASALLTTVANAQTSAQIQSGMKVYEAERCSVCHSIGGKGNQKGRRPTWTRTSTPGPPWWT